MKTSAFKGDGSITATFLDYSFDTSEKMMIVVVQILVKLLIILVVLLKFPVLLHWH